MAQFYMILLALLGLGFLVFIHELGHYIVAKRQKMKIEVFSIGFGPAIIKFKFQDVDWQICPLLFGGYVKIAGMEKTDGLEPDKVKDGFYSKSPFSRIKVALAGPIVNIAFALIAFSAIWALGGREQTFEESSKRIGWVDPNSELYKQNVRSGDRILSINGKPYDGFKDVLQSSISKEKTVTIKGEHIDYFANTATPFDLTVSPYEPAVTLIKGMKTFGVMASARYLMYGGLPNELSKQAQQMLPITSSAIEKGDRLVWAGGRILFSPQDLHHVINDGKVLVTAKRGDKVFHTRVDRLMIKDLNLSQEQRDEFLDIKREGAIQSPLKDLHILPFNLNDGLFVQGSLEKLDGPRIQSPFENSDQIIAVEGVQVSNQLDLLKSLVDPKVIMIVKKSNALNQALAYENRHDLFSDFSFSKLEKLVNAIGVNSISKVQDFYLLNPMRPISKKSFINVAAPDFKGVIENPDQKLLIGMPLADRKVHYNPNPFVMCKNVVSEIFSTFSSLFSGKISPKWLSGPVGIVRIIHQGFSLGLKQALYWLGLISLNLAVLNLLPIPALDGGHTCFALYEMITRKKLSYKTQQKLTMPFIALLLVFLST